MFRRMEKCSAGYCHDFSDLFCFKILDKYLKCSFKITKNGRFRVENGRFWFKMVEFDSRMVDFDLKWSIFIRKWSILIQKWSKIYSQKLHWLNPFVSRWINICNAVESNSAESWKSHENLWSLIWVYKTLKLT